MYGKCIECSGPLGRGNRTGRCKVCCVRRLTTDPEICARRGDGVRRFFAANPEAKAAHSSRSQANLARWRATPEGAAKLRELARRGITTMHRADAWRRAGETRSARSIAWCPPQYRDEYRRLTRSGKMPAAEARAAIEQQMRADARRQINETIAAQRLRAEREHAQSY